MPPSPPAPNTSNPHVLIGAGLLAKAAVERGLKVPPIVKTSLAPGSKVVTDYLENAGLMPYFEALGFHLTAFGCTTCIGNSGPLNPTIEKAITDNNLNVAAVLSGNRNFEARIHQNIKSNFLASPMLVVAYALAGRVDVDLTIEPIGLDPNGEPVYLDQLWPAYETVDTLVKSTVKQSLYEEEYGRIFDGDNFWRSLDITESATYAWDDASTYIKKPPYFDNFKLKTEAPGKIENARAFLVLGDSVTTDHISPAGAIPKAYPAGKHLIEKGVEPAHFNSYGSRRGNHEVMMRGTFGKRAHQKQTGRLQRGCLHHQVSGQRGDVQLRRLHAVPEGKHPAGRPRRQRIRHRFLPRPGPPKAPTCWASKQSSPNPSNASTETTSSVWEYCP